MSMCLGMTAVLTPAYNHTFCSCPLQHFCKMYCYPQLKALCMPDN